MVSLRNSAPQGLCGERLSCNFTAETQTRGDTQRLIPTNSFSWVKHGVCTAETETPRVPVVSVQQHAITPLPANLE